MDKGKSAAPSSQGIAASAWEQSSTDSDDERGEAAGWAPRVLGAGDDGASSSSAPSATPTQAIAPFEDGQYVRLRNSGRGGYLFACEDGWGVRVDSRRGMVNTTWAVQILRTADTAHVLLRSAYGRYLSPTIIPAGFGLVGCYTTQCLFEYPHPEMQWSTTMGRHGSVVLFQVTDAGMRALRANGRYLRWNTDVTFAPVNLNHISPMMEWEVQVIPQRSETTPYQTRPPNAAIAGPLRGSRAPTAAAARGKEVSVTAPILTAENVHSTFLPVLDARRRVRGHVRGSLIEGLRERVARGGDEGALNIRADILASELGAGYIGFRGRPRVIAVVYHGKRVIVNDRLHVLAAEEARVQNEDIRDRGADAEQNLPRVGEVQGAGVGAGVEQPEPHPDGHLGVDPELLELRPIQHLGGEAEVQEPPHPHPEEDLGGHAEQARPGEDQQQIDPHDHEADYLLQRLQETYALMVKKYDYVEHAWQQKRGLDRDAAHRGDWSSIAKEHRALDVQIGKSSKVYREMDEEAANLRLRLVELGIDPPSPPQRARKNPDHLTPPRQRR